MTSRRARSKRSRLRGAGPPPVRRACRLRSAAQASSGGRLVAARLPPPHHSSIKNPRAARKFPEVVEQRYGLPSARSRDYASAPDQHLRRLSKEPPPCSLRCLRRRLVRFLGLRALASNTLLLFEQGIRCNARGPTRLNTTGDTLGAHDERPGAGGSRGSRWAARRFSNPARIGSSSW